MAVNAPGVVTPFFQPYDDAIEAQEAHAAQESSVAESEHLPEPPSGGAHPEGETLQSM